MRHSLALALCIHHKPWLAMSTLITALLQDDQAFDLHFIHNVGDGSVRRASYARYAALLGPGQDNTHLSAYEPEVRSVCALNSDRTTTVEYENDHSLDSGAFYKFIRDGRWASYEHVLLAGEGTLFARPNTLSAMRRLAATAPAHFIQSGHEQRRLPRSMMLEYCSRKADPTPMDRLHDESIRETFAVFCRDPEFRVLFEAWSSDVLPETRNHVPCIPPRTTIGRRLRRGLVQRLGAPHEMSDPALPGYLKSLRALPYHLDALASWLSLQVGYESRWPALPAPTPDTVFRREVVDGVAFHCLREPEWFGCTPTLMLSRRFIEQLAARLERFHMYDVLDLPFSATGLEVVWGFLPAWLGFDKWFTDGFHRVRKDFVTYRREDFAPDMASYINRYHRGRVCVEWEGERLKLRALKKELAWLKTVLPDVYF